MRKNCSHTATSEQMEPDWGTQSVFSSRPSQASSRKARKHQNLNNPTTIVEVESRKQTSEESSSRSASPVIQMPPRNFYNYPDRYYEHRPSLFQVLTALWGQGRFHCLTASLTKVNSHIKPSDSVSPFSGTSTRARKFGSTCRCG